MFLKKNFSPFGTILDMNNLQISVRNKYMNII